MWPSPKTSVTKGGSRKGNGSRCQFIKIGRANNEERSFPVTYQVKMRKTKTTGWTGEMEGGMTGLGGYKRREDQDVPKSS